MARETNWDPQPRLTGSAVFAARMRPLDLTTRWVLSAGVHRVWRLLLDPLSLVGRWRGVSAESWNDAQPLVEGGAITWRVKAPYRTELRFTTRVVKLDVHRTIGIRADGDLDGHGECRLAPLDPAEDGTPRTDLVFEFHALPTTRLPLWLVRVPGGRRVLRWGHDRVMKAARAALVSVLDDGSL